MEQILDAIVKNEIRQQYFKMIHDNKNISRYEIRNFIDNYEIFNENKREVKGGRN